MKKFLKRGIILPLVIAVIGGSLMFLQAGKSIGALLPADNGTEILLHQKMNAPDGPAAVGDGAELSSLEEGASVGTVVCAKEIPLRYAASYTMMKDCASLEKGSAVPGDIGCAYIKMMNADAMYLRKRISLEGAFGSRSYRRIETVNNISESEALSLSPRCRSGLVIYFRSNAGNGFSSDYRAIVYEEVA